MLPSLARVDWTGRASRTAPSAFLGPQAFFVYGRYALVEALRRAGARPDTAVLLPAYHCRTVVESVLHVGAEVRLYPMTADLRPDSAALQQLIADGTVRAMLLTHYFGFANALDETHQLCAQHGVALIEDCAHAFYGAQTGHLLGSVGHYAVASAWKFLPLRDGAMLRDNTGAPANRPPRARSVGDEAKALAAMLELRARQAFRKVALPELDAAALVRRAKTIAGAVNRAPVAGQIEFFPQQVDMSGLAISRWQVAHTDHQQVMRRRRENYRHWLAGTKGLPHVHPVFPTLTEGTVPYAFPLLIDPAGLTFHALKLAGIPIWRWEDIARTVCPVSCDYRLRLLQLPCHQDLHPDEIAWMVQVLGGILTAMDEAVD